MTLSIDELLMTHVNKWIERCKDEKPLTQYRVGFSDESNVKNDDFCGVNLSSIRIDAHCLTEADMKFQLYCFGKYDIFPLANWFKKNYTDYDVNLEDEPDFWEHVYGQFEEYLRDTNDTLWYVEADEIVIL